MVRAGGQGRAARGARGRGLRAAAPPPRLPGTRGHHGRPSDLFVPGWQAHPRDRADIYVQVVYDPTSVDDVAYTFSGAAAASQLRPTRRCMDSRANAAHT